MIAIYAYVPTYCLSLYFFQTAEMMYDRNEAAAFLGIFGRCGISIIAIVSSLRVIDSWYKRMPILIVHQTVMLCGVVFCYAHRENIGFMSCLKTAKI